MSVALSGVPSSISDTTTSITLNYGNSGSTGSAYRITVDMIIDGATIASNSVVSASSGSITLNISANSSKLYAALQGKSYSGTSYSNVSTVFRIRNVVAETLQILTTSTPTVNVTYNINYRISSTAISSPTTANPINLDLASPGSIIFSWNNARNSYFRYRMDVEVYNGSNWVTTFTSSSFTSSSGTNFTVQSITNWVNSLTNAMNGGSPRNLRFTLTNQYRRATDTWVSVGSALTYTVSNGIIKQFQTFPSNNIGNSQYSFPNAGWTSSYFYIRATSILKSTGLYDVDVEVYLFAGASMNSTLTSRTCVVNGSAASVKSGFVSPVVLSGNNTMLLGVFTATNIGPFTTRSPQVTIDVTINLSQAGTRSIGGVTTPVGILPVIPALESNNIISHTVTNGTISNASLRNNQNSVGGLNGNDFSFYRIRIAESLTGTTFSNSRDSSFGASAYSTTWTSRTPYTLYFYRLQIIGRDNLEYGSSIIQLRSNDNPPVITALTLGTRTTTSISVTTGASSASALTYTFYRKLSSSGTWTTVATISGNAYNYTGLASNTLYDFKVLVTNADGLTAETGTAGQPANLTSISTFANAPVINSFTRTNRTASAITVAVSASVDSGLTATYSYGIRQGTASFVFGSYISGTSNTFSGLQAGASYDMRVRVRDSLGNIVESSTLTSLTLFAPPVISAVNILNLTNTSAVVKVSAQTQQSTSIASYQFKVYLSGGTEPTNWISRTVDNYSIVGLSSNVGYVVKCRVVDNQGLTSSIATTTFTTPAIAPLSGNVRLKMIRTTSDAMPAIRDGNLIIASDSGDMFMDTNLGRQIISYGLKVFDAIVTTSNVSITTTVFNNFTYGSANATLSFYIVPNANFTSSAATLTIIRPGSTNITNVTLERINSTLVELTANKPYLVSFANNTFYLINDR